MSVIRPLFEFVSLDSPIVHSPVPYWYEGQCPTRGDWLRLPRTPFAEAIARGLMTQLAKDDACNREGKMYGVLLVETSQGEQAVLKAFSGLLQGEGKVAGWVPPIPGRDRVALDEARTLAELHTIKQSLIALNQAPERQHYATLRQDYDLCWQQLTQDHQQRKQDRHHQRQTLQATLTGEALVSALEQLDEQSRRDGIDRRHFKRQRDAILHPLKAQIDQQDQRIHELRHQRKQLSRQLQAQLHASYWLTNFAGEATSLQRLVPGGAMPTGTGDCCAPKLLHYAATHQLKPLAMAEFWWGPASSDGDKVQGTFYGACVERCQPLMGFLLAGLPQPSIEFPEDWEALPILYQDEGLIAVEKPAGLLSVPGRSRDRQDSVLSRLRHQFGGQFLVTVHRLDQDTSGILLLARDLSTYRHLHQQFQQRTIHKVYEAIVEGAVLPDQGTLDLPLWGNPDDRPRQTVDWHRGKPSLTEFRVLDRTNHHTRLEFFPLTGRTHQLRVHAAHPAGLGTPILGDRLYGSTATDDRLHLHARELTFTHPSSGKRMEVRSKTPF